MDKGFRTWFAKLVITHLRRHEAIVVEERRAKIERDWASFFAIQHAWGFGWMIVRMFFWSLWRCAALAGILLAVIIFAVVITMIAAFSCPILPPDICPRIEIQSERTNTILTEEKNMARFLQTAEALRASVAEIFNFILGNEGWKLYEKRVCQRLGDAGIFETIAIGGVYKI